MSCLTATTRPAWPRRSTRCHLVPAPSPAGSTSAVDPGHRGTLPTQVTGTSLRHALLINDTARGRLRSVSLTRPTATPLSVGCDPRRWILAGRLRMRVERWPRSPGHHTVRGYRHVPGVDRAASSAAGQLVIADLTASSEDAPGRRGI